MKIAIDHQIFSQQAYGGISRYYVRLAEGLTALGHEVSIVAPIHCNRYLQKMQEAYVDSDLYMQYPPKVGHFISLANRVLSQNKLHNIAPDLIHETYYTSNPVGPLKVGRVTTVHDMIHEKYPCEFTRANRTHRNKRLTIDRADHLICVSYNTKNDVCELLNIAEEKVSVVHHGFDRLIIRPDFIGLSSDNQRPFLLYVGHRGGYKNFAATLRAVASKSVLKENFDIVAFGGGRLRANEMALVAQLGFGVNSVRQIEGGDDVLGRLYSTARAFVYPSIYEGFGLPPLEAMAHDCPVITSNSSSMPEVVGDAGVFFNPSDIESQADAITRVVFDDQLRSNLITAGRQRLQLFSWERSARETQAVYQKVLAARGRQ